MDIATLQSKLPSQECSILHFLLQKNPKLVINSLLDESSLNQLLNLVAKTSIDMGLELFNKVFSGLSTDYAKQSIKTNPLLQANHSFTYGDVEFSSFVNILQRCEPKKGDVFVDLGHGTGRALVAAHIVYGTTLSTIHGIELLSELVDLSHQSVSRYNTLLQSEPYSELFGGAGSGTSAISIEEGDFLKDSNNGDGENRVDWIKAGTQSHIEVHCMTVNIAFAVSTAH